MGRSFRLDDLTNNFQLKGKSYNEIIELPGEPQAKGESGLQNFYDVDIDYGSDIDPVYTKTLNFQFDKDSIVKAFEVKEWKK